MRPLADHILPSLERLTRRDAAWRRLATNPAFVSAVLALSTIGAFWPVTHAEFINYDDPQYVTANAHVLTGLKWVNVTWAFGAFYAYNWHPLTWLSHMLDVAVFGKCAGGPHCVNLALHVANSLLLFGLLRRMTGAYWRSAWVAGLFALHPLHVESVAWVSERKDVLSAFFFILTLWAFARYAQKQRRVERRESSATFHFMAAGMGEAAVPAAGGGFIAGHRPGAEQSHAAIDQLFIGRPARQRLGFVCPLLG